MIGRGLGYRFLVLDPWVLAFCSALWLLLGPEAGMGGTVPTAGIAQVLVLEGIITFILMFVIMAVATDGRAVGQMAGLAIGGTVALLALFAGPISGASMNPARTLGPALISGEFTAIWVYFIGPILGAGTGAWVYQKIRCDEDVAADAGGCC